MRSLRNPAPRTPGMADHLPHCPVREIFAEIGALHDGGPDPERVLKAILPNSASNSRSA